jgi:regulator of sigma E protease
LPNTEVLLTYSKLGTTGSITLATRPADDLYFSDRGLVLVGLSGIHMAGSLGEAISLGFRETAEKLTEVARVLKMLVTRDVSMDKLGGPITIVRVMGAEASIGFPRLLLFLTFLSANLAILNFLPIPALDGGHMVFLIIEAITGKPVDERVQGVLTLIGVLLLLLLMGYVIFNDILRI